MAISPGGVGRWDWTSVPKGSGVLAIKRRSDNKAYYVAVRDLRQRAYDQHRLLTLGVHHNHELQLAWDRNWEDFEFAAVEQVANPNVLGVYKQVWIERANGCCFNRRNALRIGQRGLAG